MPSVRIRLLLAAALIIMPLAQSCRSHNAYEVDPTQPDMVILQVRNDNFLDMDIYALSSGLPTRIGTVTGLSSARFALSSSLYGSSDFRIIATPVGGNGRASSGPLVLRGGQVVEFNIGTRLAQTTTFVR